MSKYQVVENVCDNHISVRNDVDMQRNLRIIVISDTVSLYPYLLNWLFYNRE